MRTRYETPVSASSSEDEEDQLDEDYVPTSSPKSKSGWCHITEPPSTPITQSVRDLGRHARISDANSGPAKRRRLTDQMRACIRFLYRTGNRPVPKIAEIVGCSPQSVRRLLKEDDQGKTDASRDFALLDTSFIIKYGSSGDIAQLNEGRKKETGKSAQQKRPKSTSVRHQTVPPSRCTVSVPPIGLRRSPRNQSTSGQNSTTAQGQAGTSIALPNTFVNAQSSSQQHVENNNPMTPRATPSQRPSHQPTRNQQSAILTSAPVRGAEIVSDRTVHRKTPVPPSSRRPRALPPPPVVLLAHRNRVHNKRGNAHAITAAGPLPDSMEVDDVLPQLVQSGNDNKETPPRTQSIPTTAPSLPSVSGINSIPTPHQESAPVSPRIIPSVNPSSTPVGPTEKQRSRKRKKPRTHPTENCTSGGVIVMSSRGFQRHGFTSVKEFLQRSTANYQDNVYQALVSAGFEGRHLKISLSQLKPKHVQSYLRDMEIDKHGISKADFTSLVMDISRGRFDC